MSAVVFLYAHTKPHRPKSTPTAVGQGLVSCRNAHCPGFRFGSMWASTPTDICMHLRCVSGLCEHKCVYNDCKPHRPKSTPTAAGQGLAPAEPHIARDFVSGRCGHRPLPIFVCICTVFRVCVSTNAFIMIANRPAPNQYKPP